MKWTSAPALVRLTAVARAPAWTALALIPLGLASCATSRPPEPVRTKTFLLASLDANPDVSGRASPVVVRVFELKSEAEFVAADFFALYDKERETLGSSLLGREEYVLAPGERREMWLSVPGETKFIGVVAAFRDIRGARWRTYARAPHKRVTDTFSRDTIRITVGHGGASLDIKD